MKSKIRSYVSTWKRRGYAPDAPDIPDISDPNLEALGKTPSYRMICRAILRNDVALTTLGFTRAKCDAYMELKRIEIEGRKK